MESHSLFVTASDCTSSFRGGSRNFRLEGSKMQFVLKAEPNELFYDSTVSQSNPSL